MTQDEFHKLKQDGYKVLMNVIGVLNYISEKFIRVNHLDDVLQHHDVGYRRKEDFDELVICAALTEKIVQNQTDQFRSLLLKYGGHLKDCAGWKHDPLNELDIPCTCGFEEALNFQEMLK